MSKNYGAFNHNAGVACLMMLRLALLKPLPEEHAPASYNVPPGPGPNRLKFHGGFSAQLKIV